ncbi:MAG: hypothetical protein WBB82_02080, partial [Limnothrix sp.]
MVAIVSVTVVILNALLISFGLQRLIGNMATSDVPAPDDDFQRAQDAFAQGEFEEAIAIARAIPQESPAYESAQTSVTSWEKEWQEGDQIVAKINTAHAAQDWQAVVTQAKDLGENSLFRAKVAPQIEAAQFQVDVAAYQRVQEAFELAAGHEFNQAIATLE